MSSIWVLRKINNAVKIVHFKVGHGFLVNVILSSLNNKYDRPFTNNVLNRYFAYQ